MARTPELAMSQNEAAQRFADEFPDITARVRDNSVGPEAAAMMEEVRQMHDQMADIGIKPATIINMHPFPLTVNGVLTSDITVPACPIGQSHTKYVIDTYRYAMGDKGNGVFVPRAWVPIRLAKDFEREHSGRGGIVSYVGDHEPDLRTSTKMKEHFEKAREEQVRWYKRLFQEADASFRKEGKTTNITELNRMAAHWLLAHKMIAEAPKWVAEFRSAEEVERKCARCKSMYEKGAYLCKECNFIIDPRQAWENGEIVDEQDIALARLSREVLDEMGLNHVLTLAARRAEKKEAAAQPKAKAKAAAAGAND